MFFLKKQKRFGFMTLLQYAKKTVVQYNAHTIDIKMVELRARLIARARCI